MTDEQFAHYCPSCGAPTELRDHHGITRPICTACNHVVFFNPRVAVLAFIVRADTVLLIQRAGDPGKGKWACPAGFVDAGEDPEEAVLREVHEETGLEGEITKLLDVFPKRDNGLADIVICYRVGVIGGALQPDDDAADARWVTRDNVPELVFYPSQTLVARWQRGEIE